MAGRPITLSEAKALSGKFVYGLSDLTGVFYVGQTRSARRRFQAHAEGRGKNKALRERVQAAGPDLRVVVLVDNPPDLNAAEREEIRRHGPTLLNLIGADDERWAAHDAAPWAAGTGIHSPSAYAMMRARQEVKREVRDRLAGMTPAERCAYEIDLLRSFPEKLQQRFERWLSVTRDKMVVCMEAANGQT